jgi:demethylmenaquinone methyltransferase/2-methoxy-6-polyprenyl-1,4-benzoquinol methylase
MQNTGKKFLIIAIFRRDPAQQRPDPLTFLLLPENRILRWCYNLYFMHFVPWIGGLVSGDKAAYRYLPASVQQFPGRREWTATMVRCGYTQVRHKAFTFGLCRMYAGEKKSA